MGMTTVTVQRESMATLYIEMAYDETVLASGTGFVYESGGNLFLITARHCLSGRHWESNRPIADEPTIEPNTVNVYHRSGTGVGQFAMVPYDLVDDEGLPRYYEHPLHGRLVDVVALPIAPLVNLGVLDVLPWKPTAPHPVIAAQNLSVLGFPFGFEETSKLPIWSRATVATEPGLPYRDLPLFLVDARTRTGQSGSPVLAFYPPGTMVPNPDSEHQLAAYTVARSFLVGVYTGRLIDPKVKSELGLVWHARVIDEIIGGRVRNVYGPW